MNRINCEQLSVTKPERPSSAEECLPPKDGTTSTISVAVIHDQPLFLRGIKSILKEEADISIVGEGASTSDALRIATQTRPELMILSDAIVSNYSPSNLISLISAVSKVLLLTTTIEIRDIVFKLNAGALGCLLHEAAEAELVRAIRSVSRGEICLSGELSTRLIRDAADIDRVSGKPQGVQIDLSSRESEVLRYVGQGLTNKEIGQKLCLSEKTVKHYVTCILSKTKTRNRVQAALMTRDNKNNSVGINRKGAA